MRNTVPKFMNYFLSGSTLLMALELSPTKKHMLLYGDFSMFEPKGFLSLAFFPLNITAPCS